MKHNRTISKILVPIAGAVILTTASNAAVLAQYTFPDPDGNGSIVGTDVTTDTDLNSLASSLGIGSAGNEFNTVGSGDQGFSTGSITNFLGGGATALTPHRFVRGNRTTATVVGAIANNDYFKFTLTPNATFLANLTDLFFDYSGTGTSSIENTSTFFVRSGADDFAADIGTTVLAAQFAGNSVFRRQTIDLSGASFQNLTAAIEFRIYVMNSVTATNDGVARLDNITLNGTIVPEPSSLALVGSLGVLALLRRRRA